MKCTNCGSKNRQGVQFCEECGQSLNQAPSISASGETCQTCGHANRTGVRFCEECGANLNIAMEVRPKPVDSFNCPKCKHANPTDFRFCEECGANLNMPAEAVSKTAGQLTCPNCRHLNPANFSFCEECGNPLMGMMQRPILQSRESTVQFWKKTLLVGSFIGGTILILFVAGIVILGPRASNPPAFIINNIPPTERQIMDAPTVAAPVSESTVYPSTEEVASVEPVITGPPVEQPAQPSTGSGCTDQAELLGETPAVDAVYPSHESFVKTWVIKNIGTCTWTTNYTMKFLDGEQMEAEPVVNLASEVQPNQSTMIAINMVSPIASGGYHSNWILKNASGETFGWGVNSKFEVSINVDETVMSVPEPDTIDSSLELDVPAMGGGPGSDVDQDGLDDGFEDWIANAFVPILQFAKGEQTSNAEVMRFYQVTPIYKTSPSIWNYPQYQFPEYQGPPGILITYVMTYPWDGGAPIWGIELHAGDAEAMRIFVVNPRNDPYTWNPAAIILKRHFDDPEAYYPGDFQWSATHPIVWVSENKHAMYSTWKECDDYSIGFEFCGGGYTINYPIVSGVDGFNVGERLNHPFARIPNSTLNLFTNEYVWSSPESRTSGGYDAADDFCGGQEVAVPKCGGGMNSKWWPMSDPNSQWWLAVKVAEYANVAYKYYYGAEYEICFFTGDVDKAGTDLHVDVILQGTAHSIQFSNLESKSTFGQFERGYTDCFQVGSYSLEEKLTSLTLYQYWDDDSDSEWFLDGITVKDLITGEFWRFSVYRWLDWGQ